MSSQFTKKIASEFYVWKQTDTTMKCDNSVNSSIDLGIDTRVKCFQFLVWICRKQSALHFISLLSLLHKMVVQIAKIVSLNSYLKRSLHYHTCCIVNTFASILKNSRVTFFFGLTNIFINVLRMKRFSIIRIVKITPQSWLTCSRFVSIGWTNFLYSVELPFVAGDSNHSTIMTLIS